MFLKLLTSRFYLFFFGAVFLILMLVLFLLAPVQFPVVLHKIALTVLGATLGLFFDYFGNPYARPTSYLKIVWYKKQNKQKEEDEADYQIADGYFGVFCAVTIRRALIMLAFILAVALGL